MLGSFRWRGQMTLIPRAVSFSSACHAKALHDWTGSTARSAKWSPARETILQIADVELADIAAGRPVAPPMIVEVTVVPSLPRVIGQGRAGRRVTREQLEATPPQPERIAR